MFSHPYISLTVDDQLDKSDAVKWFYTIKHDGPEGIVASTEIEPDNKQTQFYIRSANGKKTYVVVLARNLTTDEVKKLADIWNDKFKSKDFDISWSQEIEIEHKHHKIKEDVLKGIILEAAKRTHNNWVKSKVSEGWRYGAKLDTNKKVSPMCMDWDTLSESYKVSEYKRMLGLIEVLEEMGLQFIRK